VWFQNESDSLEWCEATCFIISCNLHFSAIKYQTSFPLSILSFCYLFYWIPELVTWFFLISLGIRITLVYDVEVSALEEVGESKLVFSLKGASSNSSSSSMLTSFCFHSPRVFPPRNSIASTFYVICEGDWFIIWASNLFMDEAICPTWFSMLFAFRCKELTCCCKDKLLVAKSFIISLISFQSSSLDKPLVLWFTG